MEDGISIVMATSVARDFGPMTRPIRAVVFDHDYELPPATIARDAKTLAAYAGTYYLDDESSFVIESRGDRLVIRGHGEGAAELLGDAYASAGVFPLSPTEFHSFSLRDGGLGPRVGFELEDGRAMVLELESDLGPVPSYRE